MGRFVENPVHFAADCVRQAGQCMVVRDNFVFVDDGKELDAVDHLQRTCGHVVLIPDQANHGNAVLYHASCQRMNDVIHQLFSDCLEAPVSLPQSFSEMTVGELHRRGVVMSYDDCRARVDRFDFDSAP
jgi:hypothetical protein